MEIHVDVRSRFTLNVFSRYSKTAREPSYYSPSGGLTAPIRMEKLLTGLRSVGITSIVVHTERVP